METNRPPRGRPPKQMDRSTRAENIRWLRRESGLSQHDLARETGVSRTLISYLEIDQRGGGAPASPVLRRIAAFFRVPLDELLNIDMTRRQFFEGTAAAVGLTRVTQRPAPSQEESWAASLAEAQIHAARGDYVRAVTALGVAREQTTSPLALARIDAELVQRQAGRDG